MFVFTTLIVINCQGRNSLSLFKRCEAIHNTKNKIKPLQNCTWFVAINYNEHEKNNKISK